MSIRNWIKSRFRKKEAISADKKSTIELSEKLVSDINKLLTRLLEKGDIKNARHDTILVCENLHLIKQLGTTKYLLEDKGVLVIEYGGIDKYFENIRIEKDRDNTIKQLTGRKLKYDTYWSVGLVVFGDFVGYIPTIKTEDKMITEIRLLRKSIDEKTSQDYNYQKHHSDMNTLILKLENEIDSLKTAQRPN